MLSIPNRWLGQASLLLGGCALALVYLGPGRETVDANTRIKSVVEALSSEAMRPLELSSAEVASVFRAPITEKLRVSGEIQPARSVVLRSRIKGRITEVTVQEGQAVKAGDVLVRFEASDLQSTLIQRRSDQAAAEAELSLARLALARALQLASNAVMPLEALEKAKSELDVARARLENLTAQVDMARVALGEAEVRAPFGGVVSAKLVDAGARVGDNTDLLTVVDMSALEAKVLVSTRDIPRVETGQAAELQFDGMKDRTFSATVSRINPVADTGTRFVTVYLLLPAQPAALWGGMFATGSIRTREIANAVLVPTTSLRKDHAGDYVLKIEKGHLRRQPVKVGAQWSAGTLVDITDGLDDGDTIITAQFPELRQGAAVNLTEAG